MISSCFCSSACCVVSYKLLTSSVRGDDGSKALLVGLGATGGLHASLSAAALLVNQSHAAASPCHLQSASQWLPSVPHVWLLAARDAEPQRYRGHPTCWDLPSAPSSVETVSCAVAICLIISSFGLGVFPHCVGPQRYYLVFCCSRGLKARHYSWWEQGSTVCHASSCTTQPPL